MGGASSSNHCINLEFLQEERKDDFLQTLGQCSDKDKRPIGKDILHDGGQIQNFVLMTRGAPATPKLWHSENMLCILKLKDTRDPEIVKMTCRPRDPPETKIPALKIAVPGEEGELPMHHSTVLERDIEPSSSSVAPPVSEPESVFESSSVAPAVSEPPSVYGGSSSFLAALSEPSSCGKDGLSTSSFFQAKNSTSKSSTARTQATKAGAFPR